MRLKLSLEIDKTFLLRKPGEDTILFECQTDLDVKGGARTVSLVLQLIKSEQIKYRPNQSSRYRPHETGMELVFTPEPQQFASIESDLRSGLKPLQVSLYSNDEAEGFNGDDRVREYFDKKLYLRGFGIDPTPPESEDFLLHHNVTNIEILFSTPWNAKTNGTFNPFRYFSKRRKS